MYDYPNNEDNSPAEGRIISEDQRADAQNINNLDVITTKMVYRIDVT
ncbi:20240_t:CDS:2 [Entrophospora sp. SA101]|nr:20240_t:CDS:2 [Entrophospora sp. SA101]